MIADKKVIKGALENLLHFEASSIEKIAVYSYFSKELLSKNELNLISSVFKALDRDGDGTLNYDEMIGNFHTFCDQATQAEFSKRA